MKKYILLLFFFLWIPKIVWASTMELEELTIKNGELSIPFDKLNNEYTVILNKDEYSLELDYEVKEGITVFVKDNHDLENNSVVTISLTNEKEVVEYHLQILKEEEEEVNNVFLEETNDAVENNFMFTYKNYIIPSVCLLLLFLVFKILFPKHKK